MCPAWRRLLLHQGSRSYTFLWPGFWKMAAGNLTVISVCAGKVVPALRHVVTKRRWFPGKDRDLSPRMGLVQTNPGVTTMTCLRSVLDNCKWSPAGRVNGKPFWIYALYSNLRHPSGVAWQDTTKTVVRGGYSIRFVRDTLDHSVATSPLNLGLFTNQGVAVEPRRLGDCTGRWLNSSVNQVTPPPPFRSAAIAIQGLLASFLSHTGGS